MNQRATLPSSSLPPGSLAFVAERRIQGGASGRTSVFLFDLPEGTESEVFGIDWGDVGYLASGILYRFSPDGSKVLVEVPVGVQDATAPETSGLRCRAIVLDREAGNRVIGRVPDVVGCLWEDESVLHFLRSSDDGVAKYVWDLSWPQPKVLKRLEGDREEAYFHYLCGHFADEIQKLERAIAAPVVADALPSLAGSMDTSPEPRRWYLRTENIRRSPSLVSETGRGGPAACVSPGSKWLAAWGVWSGSDHCDIRILPLGSSEGRHRIHTISPTPGRRLTSGMNWLPDDRHLLFVESQVEEGVYPPQHTYSVWTYDTQSQRKRFLTEGWYPSFVAHPVGTG